jgi:tetratricopeptide (TPR) repeat protein/DNA-binding CsgD family transcriptional regulator
MRIFVNILTFVFLAGILFGCNPQPEAASILEQAEELAENEQIDSGLRLIDSIFYPEKSLGKEKYMEYIVTRVRLRYKAFRDVTADTAIFAAWRYHQEQANNPRQTALAAFYSGCVYREQLHNDKAMQAYMDALSEAKKTSDNSLKGLIKNNIGDLLEEQGLHEQALDAFRTASQVYWRNNPKRIVAISNIGRCYLFIRKTDSAVIAFKHGLELARKNRDQAGQSLLMQNLSVAYSEKKEYPQALAYLKGALLIETDSSELPRYYVNLAKLYTSLDNKDSAFSYYLKLKEKVPTVTNQHLQSSIYEFLANWEKGDKNWDAAFDYQDKRMKTYETILEARSKSSVLDVQKKYDFEQLKNTHNQETIQLQFSLLILSLAVLAGSIFFFAYRIRRKNQMIQAQQTIHALKEMNGELNSSFKRRNADLHNAVMLQCEMAKKLMELNQDIEKFESLKTDPAVLIQRINKIVYRGKKSSEQWMAIRHTIDAVRPGFIPNLETSFPDLSNMEVRICLLTYAGFKVQEIALILDQKPNTIQTRRTSIRRKIGLNGGQDIAEFLDRKLY